jgi:hypothetical protein
MEASRNWETDEGEGEGEPDLSGLSHEELVELADKLLAARVRTQFALALAGVYLQENLTLLLSVVEKEGTKLVHVNKQLRGMLNVLGTVLDAERVVPKPVFDAAVELGLKVESGEITKEQAAAGLLDADRSYGASEEGMGAVKEMIEGLCHEREQEPEARGRNGRRFFI